MNDRKLPHYISYKRGGITCKYPNEQVIRLIRDDMRMNWLYKFLSLLLIIAVLYTAGLNTFSVLYAITQLTSLRDRFF